MQSDSQSGMVRVLCGLTHDYGFGPVVVWRNENDMYVVTVLALWKAIL